MEKQNVYFPICQAIALKHWYRVSVAILCYFELLCALLMVLLLSANAGHFLCKHKKMTVLDKANNKQQTAMS